MEECSFECLEARGGIERVEKGQEERDMALVAHLKTKVENTDFSAIAPRLGAEWSSENPGLLRFLYLGRLVEFGDTNNIFTNPRRKETEDYITGRYG